jgi:hypothetical protein
MLLEARVGIEFGIAIDTTYLIDSTMRLMRAMRGFGGSIAQKAAQGQRPIALTGIRSQSPSY